VAVVRFLDRLIGWGSNPVAAHAAAIALTGLATLLRLALDPVIGGLDRFTTYFPVILVAAVIGGVGSGLTGLAAATLAGWFVLVPPRWSFGIQSAADRADIVVFVLAGLATVLVAAALRGAIERVRESEERFRTMLEALPHMAFILRPSADIEYYNRRYIEYLGGPPPLTAAQRVALYHPDDQALVNASREAGRAADREYTWEARMRRHDGVYRWHWVHRRPIRRNGVTVAWLGTAVDIDDMRRMNEVLEDRVAERTAELAAANRQLEAQIKEREQAEARLRQAQRIEAVGQLTAGIAHDFNNLLTAVMGNIELLRPHLAGDERGARLVAAAAKAAERGARLTAQLLAFARKQRMAPVSVDLNRLITGMRGMLQSTLGATIAIRTVLEDRLWPAFADVSQIELVILNLAINARDAIAVGGTITIATANAPLGTPERDEEPPPGDYVKVSVTDTGTGIPAEILGKVFEPFFTTKEPGKGSGLGLPQVLGVAQQLGGGVRIDTRAGEGTTVSIFLPRAASEAAVAPLEPSAIVAHAPAEREAGAAVLLVDDDFDVRTVTAEMLRELGCEVIEAGSGGAALDHLAQERDRIALMIVDFAMPGMNGVEVTRLARRGRPALPVLFITGFADTAMLAADATPDEILQKPYHSRDLQAKVTKILGDAQSPGAPLTKLLSSGS
jgi:PAS domain S-box-containing protein